MKVILTSRVWNKEIGTKLDLEGDKLDLVMSKNYAKAIEGGYKNKAIKAVPKKKQKQGKNFIGVQVKK